MQRVRNSQKEKDGDTHENCVKLTKKCTQFPISIQLCLKEVRIEMKELWYAAFVLLLIGILAGFTSLQTTGGAVLNLPPTWDLPTNEFSSNGPFELTLPNAFFDPDGDLLAFTVQSAQGGARISENKLVVENSGTYSLAASDGELLTLQKLIVTIQ